jgi:bacteriorhodopsin
MVQRFVCWLHTTPTILVLVKMMAHNISWQQVRRQRVVPASRDKHCQMDEVAAAVTPADVQQQPGG